MDRRTIFTLLVVVGLLVPAGVAATTPTQSQASQPAPADAQMSGDGGTDAENYTRLYIDDRHQHLELKPGESTSFTVTVENGDDEAVEVSPEVYIPPRGERPIEESWVSIDTDSETLEPGEEREFEVEVSVPDDAELNDYGGMIAFTDEKITYPGQPERPVHSVSLNVDVWKEPTVEVRTDRHTFTRIQAGDSYTTEIVIENTGDEAVPVNPQLNPEDNGRHMPPTSRETVERSWFDIDAPNEVAPGETATVEVTVTAPDDADRGDYQAALDLGLKDPARPDRSNYWQRVDFRFQVWTQPEEPFETGFDVSSDAENIALELAAGASHYDNSELDSPSFDVTFVSPDGTEMDAKRVQVTNSGSVNLAEDRPEPTAEDSTYASDGDRQTFRYEVDDPEAGSWSVQIMPEDVMHFNYDIIRNEG
jgi:hypothetical protein